MPEIFRAFLILGCTAFGGPVAHIGYFQTEFVERRRWIGAEAFADLVALCHVLPGPASSQVGLGIGYLRGGVPGALAAWVGFTLPSAALLAGLAMGVAFLPGGLIADATRGLSWAAAAIVLQAVWHMARARLRRPADVFPICAAAGFAWAVPGLSGQLAALGLAALWGWRFAPADEARAADAPSRGGGHAWLWLAAWGLLLAVLPLAAAAFPSAWLELADRFYRTGSLVFGGGHVVLPLLKAEWVDAGVLPREALLAGYGAAQAVPGPLFTVSAYLGAALLPDGPIAAALLAVAAVFLPSIFLVLGILPYAAGLRRRASLARALSGVNLAVIGLLAAAWVDPVASGAIGGWVDAVAVATAFLAVERFRVSAPALVVGLAALAVLPF